MRPPVATPITSAPALSMAAARADLLPPPVLVEPGGEPPVKKLDPNDLRMVGMKLDTLFRQYVADRRIAELRWLRNERQYLGIYDPEIEKELSVNRSKAYPRITRVKCISVLSRLMNLMFPGNERNWEIKASPSADMKPKDVKEAIQDAQKRDQEAGVPSSMDLSYVMSAIQTLADKRANDLSTMIDDQLQELGGDQTIDYIALNRKVLQSGILYGLGLLVGPYARAVKSTQWSVGADGTPSPKTKTTYKPMFEFMKVWDFYPDLAAKTFAEMDGYFTRMVMSRSQVRALGKREDFFEDQIKQYLKDHTVGNYKPQPYELDLRVMGVKVNVNEMKTETMKYEVIVWHGQLGGSYLQMCGVEVPQDNLADELDAEIWTIDGNVIKAVLDPWAQLDTKVKTIHTFLFDQDDTSPVGFGLPNSIRDSQMAIAAATRMLLDNGSVVCGPNLEINTDLLRADQDLSSVSGYKIWYREGLGPDSQFPAVRDININSHLDDLMKIIEMFMKFADTETFVGPATGGDMDKSPSEPMRTAAGASMLRGDAALPFKDIVRNFDSFTQSVLDSLVQFNRKFNPTEAPEGDYNVIARGATSLIAKEVRGMQVDQLVTTMTPQEAVYVDMKKLVHARFAVRDMTDMLVSDEEAERRQAMQDQQTQQQTEQQKAMIEAQIRKLLSDAFKNITQGQKNSAAADANSIDTVLKLLEQGITNSAAGASNGPAVSSRTANPSQGASSLSSPPSGEPGGANGAQPLGMPSGDDQSIAGGMPAQ